MTSRAWLTWEEIIGKRREQGFNFEQFKNEYLCDIYDKELPAVPIKTGRARGKSTTMACREDDCFSCAKHLQGCTHPIAFKSRSPGPCGLCGSEDTYIDYDVGFDIDEGGEERQHMDRCRSCGAYRFRIGRLEEFRKPKLHLGPWRKR